MKKKIFGIKLGTVLTVVISLIAALAWWIVVNYLAKSGDMTALTSISRLFL